MLKEETEGLRRKLERLEKMKEDMVNLELEKEVRGASRRNRLSQGAAPRQSQSVHSERRRRAFCFSSLLALFDPGNDPR